MSQKKDNLSLTKIYSFAASTLKKYPSLYTPFFIFAILELTGLILAFLSPRQPFIDLFGPPVRAFWGEKFLHYPINFLLLAKLAYLNKIFTTIIFGPILTGTAISMIMNAYQNKQPKLNAGLKMSLKKYLPLFTFVFLFTTTSYILTKLIVKGLAHYFYSGHSKLLFLGASTWLGPIFIFISIIISILLQGIFLYAIILLLVSKERFFKALGKSFLVFKSNFLATFVLIGFPMLLYVPISILNQNASLIINKFFPELVLWILILAVFVSNVVIDLLITLTVAIRFLKQEGDK